MGHRRALRIAKAVSACGLSSMVACGGGSAGEEGATSIFEEPAFQQALEEHRAQGGGCLPSPLDDLEAHDLNGSWTTTPCQYIDSQQGVLAGDACAEATIVFGGQTEEGLMQQENRGPNSTG